MYISHLLKEIIKESKKESIYILVEQVAYASVLLSAVAPKHFSTSDKKPTEMEMIPEIEVNGPDDVKRAFDEWMEYMTKNREYLSRSLKIHDNRRIYEACMNYGWVGSVQSIDILAYIRTEQKEEHQS